MKFLFSFALFCAFALLPITVGKTAPDAEWPQWRGPLRNGLSSETGLLKQWPEKGPAVTWSIANLGEGYGSVAIRGIAFTCRERAGQRAKPRARFSV
jgi:hypothetical protein